MTINLLLERRFTGYSAESGYLIDKITFSTHPEDAKDEVDYYSVRNMWKRAILASVA